MEISNTQAAIALMLILTIIAAGSAVYTNTAGSSDSNQVTANSGNIKINFDNLDIVNGDISALKEAVELQAIATAKLASSTDEAITSLKQRDLSLDAKINERMMPTDRIEPAGQTSFRLELSSNTIEVGDSFRISGVDKANTPIFATLTGPISDQVLPLTNTNTASNGSFELATFIPTSWTSGVYTITVIIGQNFDRIVFNVSP